MPEREKLHWNSQHKRSLQNRQTQTAHKHDEKIPHKDPCDLRNTIYR